MHQELESPIDIHAQWNAPKHIVACTTTRLNGFSQAPFDAFNLGLHVDDCVDDVLKNRAALKTRLGLTQEPIWLEQTHSNTCIVVEETQNRIADAAITRLSHVPLVVMTADCVPIVLCDERGQEIAAIHAGWRGLLHGIIQNTVNTLISKPQHLLAWIGPAICKHCFNIGPEVKEHFVSLYGDIVSTAFDKNQQQHRGNLPLIAEIILKQCGINAIHQSNLCTFEDKNRFYSYRRTAKTGRMVTLICSFQEASIP